MSYHRIRTDSTSEAVIAYNLEYLSSPPVVSLQSGVPEFTPGSEFTIWST